MLLAPFPLQISITIAPQISCRLPPCLCNTISEAFAPGIRGVLFPSSAVGV